MKKLKELYRKVVKFVKWFLGVKEEYTDFSDKYK